MLYAASVNTAREYTIHTVREHASREILAAYPALPNRRAIKAMNLCVAPDGAGGLYVDRAVALIKRSADEYTIVLVALDQWQSVYWMHTTDAANRHAALQDCTDCVCAARKLTVLR